MAETENKVELPPIPAKRYFTIGEVSELCAVKPHVLRYWEQEFTQLRPVKRRGNRRYYQHHEVLLVRRIRSLLYEDGFTISGARHRLSEGPVTEAPPIVHLAGDELPDEHPTWGEVRAELSSMLEELRELADDNSAPKLQWHD